MSRTLEPQQRFTKLLEANAHTHRPHDVFRDFVAMSALSFSNTVDRVQRDEREREYMTIVGKYSAAEVTRFPEMLAALVDGLEEDYCDFLGSVFMGLDFGKHWAGQFFTPYPVALMMAKMTVGDHLAERELITYLEPAVGSGVMVIASAQALRDHGINYQQRMHVTAVDIDITAVHMAYLQLSLLHVPAIVFHGNTLSTQTWSYWLTPAHVLGRWDRKLSRYYAQQQSTTVLRATQQDTETSIAVADIAATQRDRVIAGRSEQLGLF